MKNPDVVIKSALTSLIAVGLAGFGAGLSANAQAASTESRPPHMTQAVKMNLARGRQNGWVKCYGINAANKNSCRTAMVSCGGNAEARNPNAYILVPDGLCKKIAGASLKPASASREPATGTSS